jgi:hypothetical protein
MPEGTELIQIARNSMVLVVALNDLREPFTDLRCRLMLPADQFCFYGTQLAIYERHRRFTERCSTV